MRTLMCVLSIWPKAVLSVAFAVLGCGPHAAEFTPQPEIPIGTTVELCAGADWYKELRIEDQDFTGVIGKSADPGPTILMRYNPYWLKEEHGVRLGIHGPPENSLEPYVGRRVRITGKLYGMLLEGRTIVEIWPARLTVLPAESTTRPATAPLRSGSRFQVKEINHQDQRDAVDLAWNAEVLAVMITSPDGIGDVWVVRVAGRWPSVVRVWLRRAAGRPFDRLEAFVCQLERGGQMVQVLKSSDERAIGGWSELLVPVPASAADLPELRISWVDVHDPRLRE